MRILRARLPDRLCRGYDLCLLYPHAGMGDAQRSSRVLSFMEIHARPKRDHGFVAWENVCRGRQVFQLFDGMRQNRIDHGRGIPMTENDQVTCFATECKYNDKKELICLLPEVELVHVTIELPTKTKGLKRSKSIVTCFMFGRE